MSEPSPVARTADPCYESPATPAALPCPFCGRTPHLSQRPSEHTGTGEIVFISCLGGGYTAHAHHFGGSRVEAIAKWNTRHVPPHAATKPL